MSDTSNDPVEPAPVEPDPDAFGDKDPDDAIDDEEPS